MNNFYLFDLDRGALGWFFNAIFILILISLFFKIESEKKKKKRKYNKFFFFFIYDLRRQTKNNKLSVIEEYQLLYL